MDRGAANRRSETLTVSAGALSPLVRDANTLKDSRIRRGSRNRQRGVNTLAMKKQFAFQIKQILRLSYTCHRNRAKEDQPK